MLDRSMYDVLFSRQPHHHHPCGDPTIDREEANELLRAALLRSGESLSVDQEDGLSPADAILMSAARDLEAHDVARFSILDMLLGAEPYKRQQDGRAGPPATDLHLTDEPTESTASSPSPTEDDEHVADAPAPDTATSSDKPEPAGVAPSPDPATEVAQSERHSKSPETPLGDVPTVGHPSEAAGSRTAGASPDSPAPPAIDASPTVILCRKVHRQLQRPVDEVPAPERRRLMASALQAAVADTQLNEHALGDILRVLQETDPAAYGAWVTQQMQRGLIFQTAARPTVARLCLNIVLIVRVQLIGELGLRMVHELAMLDAALTALHQYCLLTNSTKLCQMADHFPGERTAAQHATTHTKALSALKLWMDTLERLRNRKSPSSVLNVKEAKTVAIQVNQAGHPISRNQRAG